jgi:hypothetical protein
MSFARGFINALMIEILGLLLLAALIKCLHP